MLLWVDLAWDLCELNIEFLALLRLLHLTLLAESPGSTSSSDVGCPTVSNFYSVPRCTLVHCTQCPDINNSPLKWSIWTTQHPTYNWGLGTKYDAGSCIDSLPSAVIAKKSKQNVAKNEYLNLLFNFLALFVPREERKYCWVQLPTS